MAKGFCPKILVRKSGQELRGRPSIPIPEYTQRESPVDYQGEPLENYKTATYE